jgi:peptidoglycan hydrolase FlgJ
MVIEQFDRSVITAEHTARRATTGADQEKLKKACTDFEAIFIKQMFKAMDNTVERSGLLDGGMAENFFRDMLLDSYSEKAAENSRLGIADMMYKQLSGS